MADGNYELLDIKVDRIERQVNQLSIKIDGDPKIVNGGGIGLIGRVDRLQKSFYQFEDEAREEFHTLRQQIRRPPGWTALVIIGGVASLLMHLITLAAIVSLMVSLNGG